MSFLSIRGSSGLHLIQETSSPGAALPTWDRTPDNVFKPDEGKNCKVMAFSPSGNLFAWSDGAKVHVRGFRDGAWSDMSTLDQDRVSFLCFSPLGTTLATWEIFAVKQGQAAQPNMHVWNAKTGEKLASFIQRKNAGWAPQWSLDEGVCCVRSVNNEVNFYQNNDFSKTSARLSLPKLDSFDLSPRPGPPYHIACFVPGQKGGPGFGKLFTYPNFHPEKDVVATKSFFQSDRMETEWSYDGRMALLMTQSEVDKTGGSYYGKQQLHFINVSGLTAMVQLAKEGPIYSIKWSPVAAEFCVVYGYMPAKATLYNSKCEKVFDFGTGPRNAALYNPQGNLLMLGGFGNLRGNIEIWSVKDKKRVCEFEAADSTDTRWAPNGQHIMTSTCAPRLRVGNGYKIWHYTSSLLHEKPLEKQGEELWEVHWQNRPANKYPESFPIQFKPVAGIKPMQPTASKVAYRPPGMRNKPGMPQKNTKLHDEDEAPENHNGNNKEDAGDMSKSAAKNKKRREAAKKKKEAEAAGAAAGAAAAAPDAQAKPAAAQGGSTGDPDKDKKLRKLNDKLMQIQKLKAEQKAGKKLEINQLEKLKKESEILKEMEQLRL